MRGRARRSRPRPRRSGPRASPPECGARGPRPAGRAPRGASAARRTRVAVGDRAPRARPGGEAGGSELDREADVRLLEPVEHDLASPGPEHPLEPVVAVLALPRAGGDELR